MGAGGGVGVVVVVGEVGVDGGVGGVVGIVGVVVVVFDGFDFSSAGVGALVAASSPSAGVAAWVFLRTHGGAVTKGGGFTASCGREDGGSWSLGLVFLSFNLPAFSAAVVAVFRRTVAPSHLDESRLLVLQASWVEDGESSASGCAPYHGHDSAGTTFNGEARC